MRGGQNQVPNEEILHGEGRAGLVRRPRGFFNGLNGFREFLDDTLSSIRSISNMIFGTDLNNQQELQNAATHGSLDADFEMRNNLAHNSSIGDHDELPNEPNSESASPRITQARFPNIIEKSESLINHSNNSSPAPSATNNDIEDSHFNNSSPTTNNVGNNTENPFQE